MVQDMTVGERAVLCNGTRYSYSWGNGKELGRLEVHRAIGKGSKESVAVNRVRRRSK